MRFLGPSAVLVVLVGSVAGQAVPYDGFTLFAPQASRQTYLMDLDGTMVHTWNTQYQPGHAVYLLANGNLLHSDRTVNGGTGGTGGGISEIAWDGSVIWSGSFVSAQNGGLQHHDVEELPSGNILLIAWETKTQGECLAAGRNPAYLTNATFLPDTVLEVVRSGPNAGTIAWEWHAWDHLVQDFDATRANFGSVAGSPELIDINYPPIRENDGDWLHVNSVKYNASLDQICISVHDLNEVWILDHSTTTAEASGHTGGNSGMGGDLLYRWGNPEAYQRGTVGDRQLFGQHDANWIAPGSPGEGNLLIFNNGAGRPGGQYSTVVEIATPVDANGNYNTLGSGMAFGPMVPIWIYQASPASSFFSAGISGAQRQPNGNTLICEGFTGRLFEVDPAGNTVWQYLNTQPSQQSGTVFKARRYDRRLFSQPYHLSVSAGGQVSFHIEAGAMRAGQTYFLVGSASGTSPGISVGNGVVLPLNADPYLMFTVVNPNAGFLPQSLGTLDSEGASTVTLSLPPAGAPSSLVGATLHHAYVVLDLAAGIATRASNAQAFLFAP